MLKPDPLDKLDPFTGAELIRQERVRQVDVLGNDAPNDDKWVNGELAEAAEAYLLDAVMGLDTLPNMFWPETWEPAWYHPSDNAIRNLVRAGALIAAEIDRRLRAGETP